MIDYFLFYLFTYLVGGYDRGECLKSAEEYDVLKSEWRQLPDMVCGRGRFDAAAAGSCIYAVAGWYFKLFCRAVMYRWISFQETL